MKESQAAHDTSEPGSMLHVGRYVLHRQIARGGMATIHIARLMGDEGFSRIVAAKRLLPEFAQDAEFVAMFLDEARIASRVHHRNVVPVLDVVTTGDEVVLVQEYVHGAPLHWLLNKARQTNAHVPLNIAVSIACQVLAGLHAAHLTVDEMGTPLDVVHRDVSPQNVMVAADGTVRLLDFGVAKSLMAAHVTRQGTFKGKLAYSAPEQLRGEATRQSDIYSLTVLLWELIVGHRMHRTAQAEAELVATIMNGKLPTITEALAAEREWEAIDGEHWRQLKELEPIIKRGLAVEACDRYQTASEMEDALVVAVRPASSAVVAQWLRGLGKEYMERHEKVLASEEASWRRAGAAAAGARRASLTESKRPGTRLSGGSGGEEAVPSTPHTQPRSRQLRAPYVLVALLSLLVVALAIGIVIVVSGPGDPAPAAAAAPAPPPPAPVKSELAEAAGETAATVDRTEPALSIGEAETSPTRAAARPPVARPPGQRSAVRPAPASSARSSWSKSAASSTATSSTSAAAPAPTPADPPPVETRPAARESCTPPYYFEGTKKIFKPACL